MAIFNDIQYTASRLFAIPRLISFKLHLISFCIFLVPISIIIVVIQLSTKHFSQPAWYSCKSKSNVMHQRVYTSILYLFLTKGETQAFTQNLRTPTHICSIQMNFLLQQSACITRNHVITFSGRELQNVPRPTFLLRKPALKSNEDNKYIANYLRTLYPVPRKRIQSSGALHTMRLLQFLMQVIMFLHWHISQSQTLYICCLLS